MATAVEMLSKKLMNWASILDDGTREQAERTASLPFIYPHLALMPDAHLGKGATVGSVIPTLKAFTRAELDAAMRGIEWRRTDKFLDEIPGAYKPVEQVMEDARDLVEIRHTLRQIVNVKGD
jgi:tRNA-splicing ligase RtcB